MSDRASPAETDPRRRLPSVDSLLERAVVAPLIGEWGRAPVTDALRRVLADLRERPELLGGTPGRPGTPGEPTGAAVDASIVARAAERLAADARPGLHRVLNGTGVVLHTNLGRAPLSRAAARAAADLATGYSNLEYDVDAGRRGDRYGHCADLLRRTVGVEDVLVVNNNAAAVVLVVNEFARGRDVIISRGELVEIGGSFRIPDMIERAGARLVEVGTTNRTRLADYRDAIGDSTGLVLKVHPSNFRIEGFTTEVSITELAALGRERGVPVAWDLGSATPRDILPQALAGPLPGGAEGSAADVVMWSGDKLFGGPQAGIIHGGAEMIGRLRVNPFLRAFRVDKLTLAALEATLRAWADDRRARSDIPALRMLTESAEIVTRRAEAALALLAEAHRGSVTIVELDALVGAGSAPGQTIASAGWEVAGSAARLDAACRGAMPPLVGRVEDGRFLVDFRCLGEEDVAPAVEAVARALGSLGTQGASAAPVASEAPDAHSA